MDINDKIKGTIYGLAIGDCIGLRYENIRPEEINEKNIGKTCLTGIISDDTEHMFLITKSILNTRDIQNFEKDFKKELKQWLISFPINIGKTTLYSIIRSFFKKGYGLQGTGNGSVMRIAPIGLLFREDENKLKEYAESSCRITHNSIESVINSIAIASLIAYIINNNLNKDNKPKIEEILNVLKSLSSEEFWILSLNELEDYLINDIEPLEIVEKWTNGKGALGYTKYSTLLSIYCWLKYYGDYNKTIIEIIKCGGDTDTNAAIVGSLAGATIGFSNISSNLVNKLNDPIITKKDLDILSFSIINKENNIKTWKIKYLGFLKNIISLFYFLIMITKIKLMYIFKIKH